MASRLLGQPVNIGGWWIPGGGWVQPPSLCRAALAAFPERIKVRMNATVALLKRPKSEWQALAADGSDAVVLGCAGMAGFVGDIGAAVGAPVIDGVAAGVGMLTAMAAMGLRTGTRTGEFAPPPPKPYTGLLTPFARPQD